MDYVLLKAIGYLHTSFGDWLMPKITALGNRGIVWIVITVILLCIPKCRKWGIAMTIALLFSSIVGNEIIKPLVGRLRPFQTYTEFILLIDPPSGYSFPSGHTAASFAAAITLWKFDRRWGGAALVLAALIAFSRMYLFVHYPTDVLGGILLGILSAYIGVWLVKRLNGYLKITR